jgi:hypothetical protein
VRLAGSELRHCCHTVGYVLLDGVDERRKVHCRSVVEDLDLLESVLLRNGEGEKTDPGLPLVPQHIRPVRLDPSKSLDGVHAAHPYLR